MRFGVLGSLTVRTAEGDPVPVTETKVRALLAVLLVHDRRPVPAHRLVTDLWSTGTGNDLPRNPANALQNKISRLRHVLDAAAPEGRRHLLLRPGGYVLDVPSDAVDAARFRALAARAKTEPTPRTRAALLTDALALWRGPAYADFPDAPFCSAAAAALEEERLAAVEDLAETRLALGDHDAVAAELAESIARHPLRERLRAAHVRALYGAGRPTEALDSYEELRNRLADDLGLDPGPALTALHQAILRHDPELAAPTVSVVPRTAAPAPSPPTHRAPGSPRRGNLPAQHTDLIGRSEALTAIGSLLGNHRLVTLTGPGGVGKTRLALAAATDHAGARPDGAWLVELAALDAPAGPDPDHTVALTALAEAITTTLGIRDDASTSAAPLDCLTRTLRDRSLLLLLDNCEHLTAPVARLAAHLLRAAPAVHILATGQEPLGLAGEQVWTVPPLDLPEIDPWPATKPHPDPGPRAGSPGADRGLRATADPEVVERSSAVRLFVACATAAAQDFALTAENATAVALICRRLDGIPLALELAATRLKVLGAPGLLDRLDDRFRLISATRRDAPVRHQTLRAMIDWSWELLTASEQIVLRRLGVHADSCTLEAAEAVCAGDGVKEEDVLDLLGRLVDRSLVVVTEGPYGPRYRLLESVAAYSLERLREAGEYETVAGRHLLHHTAVAERARPHLRGHGQRDWLRRLDLESANFRKAVENTDDPSTTLRLVNALAWYWILRGRLREARRSLRTALAATENSATETAEAEATAAETSEAEATAAETSAAEATRSLARLRADATAWWTCVTLLQGDGDDGRARIDAALDLKSRLDDPHGLAHTEWLLGFALLSTGDLDSSETLIRRSLEGFAARDDTWGTAAALGVAATQALVRGDLTALRAAGEESARLFAEIDDRWGRLQTVHPLAALAEADGAYDRALSLHQEGLCIAEELGLWTEASHRLSGLGRIALLRGDFAGARELHERAARLSADHSDRPGVAHAEIGLGLGARRAGDLDQAETHFRSVLDWSRQVVFETGRALVLAELGFIAELRGDAATARALHIEGLVAARATGDPRALALALEGLAGVQALVGSHEHAALLLGTAAATRAAMKAPLPPAERGDVDRVTVAATRVLGPEAFTAAHTRGSHLSPDEALAAGALAPHI
ncbi:BTAD domain-containing putative transcriptional regulator [Streptomyces sp. NPDC058579]|uniref:AfsR/SARP family transcriptional regulator n=1 Tax=Streptomyces sp. NPDC058579 TaxID=3346548 RepID=UPI00364A045E